VKIMRRVKSLEFKKRSSRTDSEKKWMDRLPHNKSLQLSPKRPPGSVNADWQFQVGWVDAAGQLNSMLCGFRMPVFQFVWPLVEKECPL
jgi:hypothetical protein